MCQTMSEINSITARNLELTKKTSVKKTVFGSLLWVLDRCKSSMGTRLLKKIYKQSSARSRENFKKTAGCTVFIDNILIREDIKEKLENVYDLERLSGKIVLEMKMGKT